MGILSRFKDIMASNVNAIFNKEDKHPEKAIEKYISQMKADIGQINAETAAHEAEVKRARTAVYENEAECAKYERYLEKAREALDYDSINIYSTKLDAAKLNGAKLKEKYELASQDLEKLNAMNEKLTNDISGLESKLGEINSKLREAEAKEKMNKIASKSGVASQQELFNKMNDKADYILDRAAAEEELERSSRLSDYDDIEALADKYKDNADSDTGSDESSGDGTIDIM